MHAPCLTSCRLWRLHLPQILSAINSASGGIAEPAFAKSADVSSFRLNRSGCPRVGPFDRARNHDSPIHRYFSHFPLLCVRSDFWQAIGSSRAVSEV
jgi:hypothetical protein